MHVYTHIHTHVCNNNNKKKEAINLKVGGIEGAEGNKEKEEVL